MMRDENRVKKCEKYLILLNKLAGVVQWQNGSFPSCIRGFDSLRPLQSKARRSAEVRARAKHSSGSPRSGAAHLHRDRTLATAAAPQPAIFPPASHLDGLETDDGSTRVWQPQAPGRRATCRRREEIPGALAPLSEIHERSASGSSRPTLRCLCPKNSPKFSNSSCLRPKK